MKLNESIMLLIYLILDNVSREILVKSPTLNRIGDFFWILWKNKTYGTFRLTHISDIYNNIVGDCIDE